MECTIGWKKTKNGYLVFKNRDRLPEENVDSNFLHVEDNLILFGDKIFGGKWFGVNKYFSISTAYGPHNINAYQGTKDIKNENFEINEIVLREAKSLDEATEMYKKLYSDHGVTKSFNVIICNKDHANILEITDREIYKQKVDDFGLRTNSFKHLLDFNTEKERVVRSDARYAYAEKILSQAQSPEDIVKLLSSHSDNELENVCRHDYGITVGSVVAEVSADKIILHYLLNERPCKGTYKKKVIQFS